MAKITENGGARAPNGMGCGGAAYGEGVRECPVRKDGKSAAVMPSAATVADGSYPVTRLLYFYTRNKPAGDVKKFVDWVLSPEGQGLAGKVGYYPLK